MTYVGNLWEIEWRLAEISEWRVLANEQAMLISSAKRNVRMRGNVYGMAKNRWGAVVLSGSKKESSGGQQRECMKLREWRKNGQARLTLFGYSTVEEAMR
jgi:hypothetical protein